jgi:hypothetical protein
MTKGRLAIIEETVNIYSKLPAPSGIDLLVQAIKDLLDELHELRDHRRCNRHGCVHACSLEERER